MERDSTTIAPISFINNSSYPSHTDLSSTSFSHKEDEKYAAVVDQLERGQMAASRSNFNNNLIHNGVEITTLYSGNKVEQTKHNNRDNKMGGGNNEIKSGIRSFVVEPFKASIEIANAFQDELEHLASSHHKEDDADTNLAWSYYNHDDDDEEEEVYGDGSSHVSENLAVIGSEKYLEYNQRTKSSTLPAIMLSNEQDEFYSYENGLVVNSLERRYHLERSDAEEEVDEEPTLAYSPHSSFNGEEGEQQIRGSLSKRKAPSLSCLHHQLGQSTCCDHRDDISAIIAEASARPLSCDAETLQRLNAGTSGGSHLSYSDGMSWGNERVSGFDSNHMQTTLNNNNTMKQKDSTISYPAVYSAENEKEKESGKNHRQTLSTSSSLFAKLKNHHNKVKAKRFSIGTTSLSASASAALLSRGQDGHRRESSASVYSVPSTGSNVSPVRSPSSVSQKNSSFGFVRNFNRSKKKKAASLQLSTSGSPRFYVPAFTLGHNFKSLLINEDVLSRCFMKNSEYKMDYLQLTAEGDLYCLLCNAAIPCFTANLCDSGNAIMYCSDCGIAVHDDITCRRNLSEIRCCCKSSSQKSTKKMSSSSLPASMSLDGKRSSSSGGGANNNNPWSHDVDHSDALSTVSASDSNFIITTIGANTNSSSNNGGTGSGSGSLRSNRSSHKTLTQSESTPLSVTPTQSTESFLQFIPRGSIQEEDEKDGGSFEYVYDSDLDDDNSRKEERSASGGPSYYQYYPSSSSSSSRYNHTRSVSMVTDSTDGVTTIPSSTNNSHIQGHHKQSHNNAGGDKNAGGNINISINWKHGLEVGVVQKTKSTPDLTALPVAHNVTASTHRVKNSAVNNFEHNDQVDVSKGFKSQFRFKLDAPENENWRWALNSSAQVWDSSVPQEILEKIPKNIIQEQSAIHEFIHTEASFLNNLDIVEEIYAYNIQNVIDWKQWSGAKKFLNPNTVGVHVIDTLFGPPEVRKTLRSLSHRLITSLCEQKQVSQITSSTHGENQSDYIMHVSDILYNHFCNEENVNHYVNAFHQLTIGQEMAKRFYDECYENSADFKKFIVESNHQKLLKRRTLIDTRTSIMQRPHKYVALFAGMLKCAKKEFESSGNGLKKVEELTSCEKAIESILTQLNEKLYEHEQRELFTDIMRRTESKPVFVNYALPIGDSSLSLNNDKDKEIEQKFDKNDLIRNDSLRLLKTFNAKLNTNKKDGKDKNVLILVMNFCVVFLEVKDPGQYALLSVSKQRPIIEADNLLLSASETLPDEQVHLIDKKVPLNLNIVKCESRSDKNEFFRICNSIMPKKEQPVFFPTNDDNSGKVNPDHPKSHSFKSPTSFDNSAKSSHRKISNHRSNSQPKLSNQNTGTQPLETILRKKSSSKSRSTANSSWVENASENLNDSFTLNNISDSSSKTLNTTEHRLSPSSFIEECRTNSNFRSRVDACYIQLENLLQGNHEQSLSDNLKKNIHSLMGDLANLKASASLNSKHAQCSSTPSPSSEFVSKAPANSNVPPTGTSIIRSESCKSSSQSGSNNSHLLDSIREDGSPVHSLTYTSSSNSTKRHASFALGDIHSGKKLGEKIDSSEYQSNFKINLEMPTKKKIECSCNSGAANYISELENALEAKNQSLEGARSYIFKLENEIECKNKELISSKKDSLQLQLDVLVNEAKRQKELKKLQQNWAKDCRARDDSFIHSSSSKRGITNAIGGSPCDCIGDEICSFHKRERPWSMISNSDSIAASKLMGGVYVGRESRSNSASEFNDLNTAQLPPPHSNVSTLSPNTSSSFAGASSFPGMPPSVLDISMMTSSPNEKSTVKNSFSSSHNSTIVSSSDQNSYQTNQIKRANRVQYRKLTQNNEIKQQLPSKLMVSATATSSDSKKNKNVSENQTKYSKKSQPPQQYLSNSNLFLRRRGDKDSTSSLDFEIAHPIGIQETLLSTTMKPPLSKSPNNINSADSKFFDKPNPLANSKMKTTTVSVPKKANSNKCYPKTRLSFEDNGESDSEAQITNSSSHSRITQSPNRRCSKDVSQPSEVYML